MILEILKDSKSISDACRKLNIPVNGGGIKKVKDLFIKYGIDVPIYKQRKRIERLEKICPVCKKTFITKKNKREKTTCSHSCSNTYFRSNKDNPNWKDESYRTTCFLYHEKECVVCKENNIVEVHHYDGNKDNNNPENLIPLCPTHHKYWHSKFRYLIEDIIVKYRNVFINETMNWWWINSKIY